MSKKYIFVQSGEEQSVLFCGRGGVSRGLEPAQAVGLEYGGEAAHSGFVCPAQTTIKLQPGDRWQMALESLFPHVLSAPLCPGTEGTAGHRPTQPLPSMARSDGRERC